MSDPIQSLCEAGQRALLATDYLATARYLTAAENLAWIAADYDALARLYMPLQEARRQRRQFSGDGAFATIYASTVDDWLDASRIAEQFPKGQLIVAGFGTIAPAVALRAIAEQHDLYLDLPLAACYRVQTQATLLLVPLPDAALPPAVNYDSIDALLKIAPKHSLALPADALGPKPRGDADTFGTMMTLWESLHAPFLAAADAETDLPAKLAAYRLTTRVDYACEFAHQRFSHAAHILARQK